MGAKKSNVLICGFGSNAQPERQQPAAQQLERPTHKNNKAKAGNIQLPGVTQGTLPDSGKQDGLAKISIGGIACPVRDAIVEQTDRILREWYRLTEEANSEIDTFVCTTGWKAEMEVLPDLDVWVRDSREHNAPFVAEVLKALSMMLPEVRECMDRHTDLTGISSFITEKEVDEGKLAFGNTLQRYVDKANKRLIREAAEQDMPAVSISIKNRLEKVDYPLDKLNARVWNVKGDEAKGRTLLPVQKSGSKKPLNIVYSIDFDEVEAAGLLSKNLDAYDKRVYRKAARKPTVLTVG